MLDGDQPLLHGCSSASIAMRTTFAEKIVTGLAVAVVLAGLAAGRLTAKANARSYEAPFRTDSSVTYGANHRAATPHLSR